MNALKIPAAAEAPVNSFDRPAFCIPETFSTVKLLLPYMFSTLGTFQPFHFSTLTFQNLSTL